MRIILITLVLFLSLSPLVAEPIDELKVLSPFIGTWTSVQKPDDCEKFIDVQKWEWAFRGKVIRLTHSVNEGEYSGESLIHWDAATKQIIYRYVNTSDYYTDGVFTVLPDGSLEVREHVYGPAKAGRESLSGYRIENGQMHVWSKFLTDGKWSKEDHYVFNRTPDAEVVLSE